MLTKHTTCIKKTQIHLHFVIRENSRHLNTKCIYNALSYTFKESFLQKLSQVHYDTIQIHLRFIIHFQRKFLQKLSQVHYDTIQIH